MSLDKRYIIKQYVFLGALFSAMLQMISTSFVTEWLLLFEFCKYFSMLFISGCVACDTVGLEILP